MAGGGIVAGGILLIIVGLILPGVGAQQSVVQVGGYQVTRTTYPYAGLGQGLLILGIILLPIGFVAMAASSASRRREERERAQEREELYDLVGRTNSPSYVPIAAAPPLLPNPSASQTQPAVTFRSFCPECGQHLNSEFCPDDGTKTKPLGDL